MARPRNSFPKFCTDATGRAFTKANGRFISLGRADDPDSQKRYAEILRRFVAGELDEPTKTLPTSTGGVSINVLLLRFVTDEMGRYSPDEQRCLKAAMKLLRSMFGQTPAAEFGPLKLRVVRDAMVKGDAALKDADGKPSPRKPWSRGFANRQVKRLKHIFRWGVGFELVPSTVVDALAAVAALRQGETEAADHRPRRAVPPEHLHSVRAVLCEKHRDLFDMLLLTGARPGEIVGLTVGMIDRTGDVWRAEIANHKTRHHGKTRVLFFNTTAQAILLKYLEAPLHASLFSIKRDTFSAAVKTACLKAGVPRFSPHSLRHTVATKLADEMGTEAAQRLLGHAGKAMTEHYSKSAEKVAIAAAVSLG